MWGRGQRGNNASFGALCWLSVTSPAVPKQIGLFWCWFPDGLVCVHSRTLWVSPTNCPVRLGVYPATTTSTGFYSQRFWGFISPCWNPGLYCLSHSLVVLPSYLHANVGPPGPPSTALLWSSLPSCLCLPLLPVWMNVSSLSPWLLEFHTVWFSVSSGCF